MRADNYGQDDDDDNDERSNLVANSCYDERKDLQKLLLLRNLASKFFFAIRYLLMSFLGLCNGK